MDIDIYLLYYAIMAGWICDENGLMGIFYITVIIITLFYRVFILLHSFILYITGRKNNRERMSWRIKRYDRYVADDAMHGDRNMENMNNFY